MIRQHGSAIGVGFSVHAESFVSLDPFGLTRNPEGSEAIEPLHCIRPHPEGNFAILVHSCFELLHETAVDPIAHTDQNIGWTCNV